MRDAKMVTVRTGPAIRDTICGTVWVNGDWDRLSDTVRDVHFL